jgi:hypothetical protein
MRPKNFIIGRVAGLMGRRDHCPAGRVSYDATSPGGLSIFGPDHETETCSRHLRPRRDASVCSGETRRNAANPKSTLAQVQKVIQIISGNKTKLQQYCEIAKLDPQIADAHQRSNRLEVLVKRADDLGQKIGPEYVMMMEGLAQIDDNSREGRQIADALDSLDKTLPIGTDAILRSAKGRD